MPRWKVGVLVGDDKTGKGKVEKRERSKRAGVTVAYVRRPHMLIADTGNGCRSPRKTAELKYPDPGPDVVEGDGEYPLELPTGEC